MGWYLARSLQQLRAEVNTAFPNRDKRSDGTIGDAAHSATVSDHNPHANGRVDALDIDEDLRAGLDLDHLAEHLRKRKDPRIKYVIYEGRMLRSYPKPGIPAWTWAPYTGSNAHMIHMHISVNDDRADDTRSWGVTRSVLEGQEVALTSADKAWIASQLVESDKRTSSWVWTRFAYVAGGTSFAAMFRDLYFRVNRYLDSKNSETLTIVRGIAGEQAGAVEQLDAIATDVDELEATVQAQAAVLTEALAQEGIAIAPEQLEAALRNVLGSLDN